MPNSALVTDHFRQNTKGLLSRFLNFSKSQRSVCSTQTWVMRSFNLTDCKKTNYCRWDPSISQSWWMHLTTTETFGKDLSECYAANLSGKTVLTITFANASLMHSKKLKERPFQTKSCRTIGECPQRKTRYKDMNFCTIKLCQTIRTLSKGLLSLTSVDTLLVDFQSPNLKSKRLIHYMTICLRTLYSGAPVSNKGFRALKWAINIQKPTRLHHKRWTTPPS